MNYLLGIDVGTSGTKTVLFDEGGRAVSSATAEYPMYQPKNGWAEQDPADWWGACVKTIRAVLQESGAAPADVAGVGLSGQMHGLVLLDEAGDVLRRSILWCDGRTGAQCQEINERVGAGRLIEITANPALAGFTASKILWVRENEPELYRRCRHILLPKDYIRYRLTGLLATEVSDASGMNLMDIPSRNWSAEILEKLEIDPPSCPKRTNPARWPAPSRAMRPRRPAFPPGRRSCAARATTRPRPSARGSSKAERRSRPSAPPASCTRTPTGSPSTRRAACTRSAPPCQANGRSWAARSRPGCP